jgi:hypothetical protein
MAENQWKISHVPYSHHEQSRRILMKLYNAAGACSLAAHIVLPVYIACVGYAFEVHPEVREVHSGRSF